MFFGQHKDIVCLANSQKPLSNNPYVTGGHCVAGRSNAGWIRPVSAAAETGALSLQEINLGNNSEPRLLDIIRVPVLRQRPEYAQPENWLIAPNKAWRKIGQFDRRNIARLLERPATLWENAGGKNDRVSVVSLQATPPQASLYLIQPTDLIVHHVVRSTGNPQIRATFVYNQFSYDFVVTDPIAKERYLGMGVGQYNLPPATVLCISLGEAFKGDHYKLVAAVI